MSGAGGARTHDRRIMSPRDCRSCRSGSVLTCAHEPSRQPADPGELQPELQPPIPGRQGAMPATSAPPRITGRRSRPETPQCLSRRRPGRSSARGVHTRHAEAHSGCTPLAFRRNWARWQNAWQTSAGEPGPWQATHATATPSVSAPGWRRWTQAVPRARRRLHQETFTTMIEGVREAAIGGLIKAETFDTGVRARYRTAEAVHGVFCYTFFKGPAASRRGTNMPPRRPGEPVRAGVPLLEEYLGFAAGRARASARRGPRWSRPAPRGFPAWLRTSGIRSGVLHS
jgi:hypothetical protein